VTFSILSCFPHIQPVVFQAPRQSRHPERSASQIYRVTQRLWRGVEGPRRCFSYPCCSGLSTTEAREHDLLRYALGGHGYIFSCTVIIFDQALAAIGRSETFQRALLMLHDAQIQVAGDGNVKRAYRAAENVDVAAGHGKMLAALVLGFRERSWRGPPGAGFSGRKAPNCTGKIAPPRSFDSAPSSAAPRDKSVRRSAQDDDFVGVLKKNIPNKVALMGRSPGLRSAVPVRQAQGRLYGTESIALNATRTLSGQCTFQAEDAAYRSTPPPRT
jgi:hypothetical protein